VPEKARDGDRHGHHCAGRVPKEVLLEVSDMSATDGFRPIADIKTSGQQKDGETFAIATPVPGRGCA
jgi:hypothetical protein